MKGYFSFEIISLPNLSEFDRYMEYTESYLLILGEYTLLEDDKFLRKINNKKYVFTIPVVLTPMHSKDTNSRARIYIYDKPDIIFDTINRCFEEKLKTTDKKEDEELTNREKDVLKLIALGHSNKEIADKLYISIHTVISHRKNITEKLGIKSISGLTVYAIIKNLIDTTIINPEDLI